MEKLDDRHSPYGIVITSTYILVWIYVASATPVNQVQNVVNVG